MPRPKPATPGAKKTQKRIPARSREGAAASPHAVSEPVQREADEVLSAADCLRELCDVAELVRRRLLKPSEAAALRGIYETMLSHYRSIDAPQEKRLPDDVVLQLYQTNPQILSRLESMLTDEQMAIVMREVQDGAG